MNDGFAERVSAAAVAGWWTLLIGVIFITLQWLAYLLLVPAQPAWLLYIWGRNVSWPFVEQVWFWGVAAFKFCLWLLALIVVWLTLWARRLRRTG